MSNSTLGIRILVVLLLCWTLFKIGRTVYHFFHRRALKKNGYTVIGTVVYVTTVSNANRQSNMVKVRCTVRYVANDGQTYETKFIGSYTQAALPRLGDVTDVYVNPAKPSDAEADHYAKPPYV